MCEGLSQKKIAERVDISPSTVHYIINGDREPSKEMAIKLFIATGVAPAAWLFPENFYNPYIPFEDAPLDGRMWLPPVRKKPEEWAKIRHALLEMHNGEHHKDMFLEQIYSCDPMSVFQKGVLSDCVGKVNRGADHERRETA